MNKITFKIGDGDPKAGLSALSHPVNAGLNTPLFVIAGPCVIESKQLCLDIANKLVAIADNTGVPIIFKARALKSWSVIFVTAVLAKLI